jgi:predicted CoA-binding protein
MQWRLRPQVLCGCEHGGAACVAYARRLPMPITDDTAIAALLSNARTIALVGASDRPDRASHEVMAMLQRHGYRVLPVNPAITGQHILGEYVWDSLDQIGVPIDIVDIFRRSEAVGPIVDAAIAAGAKAVWMQLGVINPEAAAKAEAAGLQVVMDRCPKIEIRRLGLPKIAA